MIRRALFCIVILMSVIAARAQTKKISTLSFDTIYHAGINPAGELFVVSSMGVSKFDKEGVLLQKITLPNTRSITSFDSWHLTKTVIYYRNQQKIEVYSPQLDFRNLFTIDSVFAIEPFLIAASFDEKHYWIFDMADKSLKKINSKTHEVIVDEVIGMLASETILSMREYQHFLFLQTPSRLLVFNAMGKSIRSIALAAATEFSFFGEELLLVTEKSLLLLNLFTPDQRTLALPKAFQSVLITDNRMFGVSGTTVEIFDFQPN